MRICDTCPTVGKTIAPNSTSRPAVATRALNGHVRGSVASPTAEYTLAVDKLCIQAGGLHGGSQEGMMRSRRVRPEADAWKEPGGLRAIRLVGGQAVLRGDAREP